MEQCTKFVYIKFLMPISLKFGSEKFVTCSLRMVAVDRLDSQ